MALRKIREGNTTRILSEEEYRKEQSDKALDGCVGRLIQLGLSGWGAGYFWLKFCVVKWNIENPILALGLALAVFIIIFIVLGKIGKALLGGEK